MPSLRVERDIFALAEEWREKWEEINSAPAQSPEKLGALLRELRQAERRLADFAASRPLELPEVAAVTDVELRILREVTKSPIARYVC